MEIALPVERVDTRELRVSEAESDTFEAAYSELHRHAYRVAYRLLGTREDAADVAQEACARAFARWREVMTHPNRDAWVSRVAANLAIDVFRRRRLAARRAQPSSSRAGELDGERVDLHRALDALPKRQRQVVLLRYVADLPEAAVATALRCSVGTVKSQASRGLAALRITLGTES